MDENQKISISISRKKYLKENPEKHVWKRHDKFKSEPCELFKNKLKENSINFIEEYTPLTDRFFSIDIAFPDKKIGIEINGNQHYDRDGKLKKYYQERHDLIVKEGWKLFEYHYSVAYNKEYMSQIIEKLKNDFELGDIDYSFYINKKKENNICECGKNIKQNSKKCRSCNDVKWKKGKYPEDINILIKEVSLYGYRKTGKKYGVTDNAVKKYIKRNSDITCTSIFSSKKYPKDIKVLIDEVKLNNYEDIEKKYGVSVQTIKYYIKRNYK
jgi:very-short-patch-repair endonuclease